MRILINLIVIFSLFHITTFGQNEEVLNKKWSLGINYMYLKGNRLMSSNDYNYFGLSFEHKIYKRLFICTGIKHRRRKEYKEWDYSLWSCIFGTCPDKGESESTENNLIIPIDFKCYFSINKKKTIQAFAMLGLENQYISIRGITKLYYGETVEETKININDYRFYGLLGGGLEINFYPIGISIETFYSIPNTYKYNLKRIGNNHYGLGIMVGINYLFIQN